MCVIISGKSSTIRQTLTQYPELVESIYTTNPDGLGMMWMGDDGPVASRHLPKSTEEAREILLNLLPTDDREAAIHARWATHGEKNLDQCHPYKLDGGLLMHNGVLSIGNAADRTKSDTWHYSNAYLNGSADLLLLDARGQRLVSEHIGDNNRFVYLSITGEMVILNRDTGVEYNGLWFANTYAWDVGILDPKWRKFSRYSGGDPRGSKGYSRTDTSSAYANAYWATDAEDYDPFGDGSSDGYDGLVAVDDWRDRSNSLAWMLMDGESSAEQALTTCGANLVKALVDELGTPILSYDLGGNSGYDVRPTDLTEFDRACLAIVDGDVVAINDYLRRGGQSLLSEALVYGVDWVPMKDKETNVSPFPKSSDTAHYSHQVEAA